MSRALRRIPRCVWLLGWASLLTDTASEAIYPVLPLFLTRVLGATAFSLGLIEGVAESTQSVLKLVSGRLSDRWQVRRPLVLAGYSLSSAVRPLIALVTSWPQVLALRFVDRMGKGVRGAPRDAMLAGFATESTRGQVYGLHRAMDHAGAVAGPLLAALFLAFFPERYRTLFALTLLPGALAVFVLSRLPREERPMVRPGAEAVASAPDDDAHAGWRGLPRPYFVFLAIVLLFTLGNASDAFLLLRLADLGAGPAVLPLLWAALHIVKTGASLTGGALSDRVGRRSVIAAGWIVYAVVYFGFARAASWSVAVAWFLVYGVFYGLTEGPEKALVADFAPAPLRGTAFGLYHAATGVAAFAASAVCGAIWVWAGPQAAFAWGAGLALLAAGLLAATSSFPSHSSPA